MSTAQRIHYTELSPAPPNDPIGVEWETYRREVGRLLAEGHEGKFALIKGNTIVGMFGSKDEATDEGLRRFLMEPWFVHQIRTWEPVVWTRRW
jgi:hypothetical protein